MSVAKPRMSTSVDRLISQSVFPGRQFSATMAFAGAEQSAGPDASPVETLPDPLTAEDALLDALAAGDGGGPSSGPASEDLAGGNDGRVNGSHARGNGRNS